MVASLIEKPSPVMMCDLDDNMARRSRRRDGKKEKAKGEFPLVAMQYCDANSLSRLVKISIFGLGFGFN